MFLQPLKNTPFCNRIRKQQLASFPITDSLLEKAGLSIKERQQCAALRSFGLMLETVHHRSESSHICKLAKDRGLSRRLLKEILRKKKHKKALKVIDERILDLVVNRVGPNFAHFIKNIQKPKKEGHGRLLKLLAGTTMTIGVWKTVATWSNVMVHGKKVETPFLRGIPSYNLLNIPGAVYGLFKEWKNLVQGIRFNDHEMAGEGGLSVLGGLTSLGASVSSGLSGLGYLLKSGLENASCLSTLSGVGACFSSIWLIPESLGLYRTKQIQKEIEYMLKITGNTLESPLDKQVYSSKGVKIVLKEILGFLKIDKAEHEKEYLNLLKESKHPEREEEKIYCKHRAMQHVIRKNEKLLKKRFGMDVSLDQIEKLKKGLKSRIMEEKVSYYAKSILLIRGIQKSMHKKKIAHYCGIASLLISFTGLLVLSFTPLAPLAYSMFFISVLISIGKIGALSGMWSRFKTYLGMQAYGAPNARIASTGNLF